MIKSFGAKLNCMMNAQSDEHDSIQASVCQLQSGKKNTATPVSLKEKERRLIGTRSKTAQNNDTIAFTSTIHFTSSTGSGRLDAQLTPNQARISFLCNSRGNGRSRLTYQSRRSCQSWLCGRCCRSGRRGCGRGHSRLWPDEVPTSH